MAQRHGGAEAPGPTAPEADAGYVRGGGPERRRLAEILHDDLQQVLAAAKFHLGLMRNRAKYDSSLQTTAAQVDHMLKDAIEKSRSLSHELSPAVMHHADFVETLRWLAERDAGQAWSGGSRACARPSPLTIGCTQSLPVQGGPGAAVQRGQARPGQGGQNPGAAARPMHLPVRLRSWSRL